MKPTLVAAAVLLLLAGSVKAAPGDDAALLKAVRALDVEGVADALDRGANPNAAHGAPRSRSALYEATYGLLWDHSPGAPRRAVEIVTMLFARGATLSMADHGILFFPVSEGSTDLVTLFLDHGASPTARIDGFTPTELAKKHGREDVYQLLLSRGGIPVDAETAAQAALVDAASKGDIQGMVRALAKGAKINSPDASGRTPLLAAMRKPLLTAKYADAVSWLLDHGADPNLHGESSFTRLGGVPLNFFMFLTKLEPNSNVSAARVTAAERLLRRFIKMGARVSSKDEYGLSPLHVAAQFDNVRGAEILIESGAKVMPRDKEGKTPLDYAESGAMIRLLKRHGARE